MADYSFLSPRREEIASDATAEEMGISDGTYRNHRAETINQSQQALSELVQVAQSTAIDNRKALPPEQVGELIEALFVPTIEPEGYEEYRRDLYFHVRRALDAGEELTD